MSHYHSARIGRSNSTYNSEFMTKVYGWMTFALFITGFVSIFVSATPVIMNTLIENTWLFYGLLIGEIILVIYLAASIDDLSYESAFMLFFIYSALNGVTLSIVFLIYTAESVATTFFITGGTFGAMSLWGLTTKQDLSSWGNILFMGLIGLIIAGVANVFIGSETFQYVISFIGVIVFVALTAYDTQKIKNLSHNGDSKDALMGALTLYLDFINLFLYLLRFLGNKK